MGVRTASESTASKTRRRALLAGGGVLCAIALALACALALPDKAHAENDGVQVGDFQVTGGVRDKDYRYETYNDNGTQRGTLTILSATELGIETKTSSSVTTRDNIVVDVSSGSANLNFYQVRIDASGRHGRAALEVRSGGLNLTLFESEKLGNLLYSGDQRAGLENRGNPLVIKGKGYLEAKGGDWAAGIGGPADSKELGDNSNGSNILIDADGGKVDAKGGARAAGIGGGGSGSGSNITVAAGEVVAKGGQNGAGIGGGYFAFGSNITIAGGTVYATGGASAAGIGGGNSGSGSDITVEAGTVLATGGQNGAGIGGGQVGKASNITVEAGTVLATGGQNGAGIGGGIGGQATDVAISGGRVKAVPGAGASAIGDASGTAGVRIVGGLFADDAGSAADPSSRGSVYGVEPLWGYAVRDSGVKGYPYEVFYCGADLIVSGGTPDTDYSYDSASGVLAVKTGASLRVSMKDGVSETSERIVVDVDGGGAADLTLAGVSIDASAIDGRVALLVEDGSSLSLTLADGTANALESGEQRAGLENRENPLTIRGTGHLEAKGGAWAAGIGGPSDSVMQGRSGNGSNITIDADGGTVAATGGAMAAGIGGGGGGSGSNITVAAGSVVATGGSSGAGIGGGRGGRATDIVVSGGRVKAVPGEGASAIGGNNGTAGVRIVGGLFADAAGIDDNKVYGIEPQDGYLVIANDGSDKETYQAAVVGKLTLSIVAKSEFVYDGESLGVDNFDIEASRVSKNDALGDVVYTYQAESASGWTSGFPTAAGKYKVKAALSEGNVNGTRYPATEKTTDVTITPIALTAEVDGTSSTATKVYDRNAGFTGVALTLKGVIGVDEVSATADGEAASASAGTHAFAATSVGLSGAAKGNYTLEASAVTGNAVITPIALTAEVDGTSSTATKVYDRNAGFTGVALTLKGVIGVDEVSATADGEAASASAGTHAFAATSVGLSGAAKGNYTLEASAVTGNAVITPIALTASVDGAPTKVYDGSTSFSGVALALSGALQGDEVSATASGEAASASAGTHAFAATSVGLSGAAKDNYTLEASAVTGNAVITPIALEAEVDGTSSTATKVYDRNAGFTGVELTLSGALPSDEVSATASGNATSADAGAHDFEAESVALSGGDKDNYTLALSGVKGRVTIAKAGSDVAAESYGEGGEKRSSFAYGEKIAVRATPLPSGDPAAPDALALEGPRAGQMALFLGDVQVSAPADARSGGSYVLVCDTASKLVPMGVSVLSARFVGDGNMAGAEAQVQVEMTARPLGASVDGTPAKAYDGTPGFDGVALALSGVLAGDVVSATASGAAVSASAGEHAFSVSSADLAGTDMGRYSLDLADVEDDAQARITPKALTAEVDGTSSTASRVYDGAPGFSGVALELVGVVGNDKVSATASGEAASASAGTHDFKAESVELSGAAKDNYSLEASAVGGYVTIVKAGSGIGEVGSYGEDGEKRSSFAYGEKIAVRATPQPSGEAADAGALSLDAPEAGQMALFYKGAQVSEAADPDRHGSYELVCDTASKLVPVGRASLTARFVDDGNMAGAEEVVEVVLLPRVLTASVDGSSPTASKAYDGSASFSGVALELEGVLTGDVVSATADGEAVSASAGTHALSVSTALISGDDEGWYALAPSRVSGAVSIVPLGLTASVDEASPTAAKSYDSTSDFSGVALTLSGVLEGDVVFASADGTSAAVAAGSWKFAASSATLSGPDAGGYVLAAESVSGDVSIARTALVLRALDATMIAGGPLPALTYEAVGLAAGDRVVEEPVLSVDGDTSAPGALAISIQGGRVDNQDSYEVSYASGTLSVAAAPSGGDPAGGEGPSGVGPSAAATPLPFGGKMLAPTGDATTPFAVSASCLAFAAALAAFAARRAGRRR